jgi:hypothetical protein
MKADGFDIGFDAGEDIQDRLDRNSVQEHVVL